MHNAFWFKFSIYFFMLNHFVEFLVQNESAYGYLTCVFLFQISELNVSTSTDISTVSENAPLRLVKATFHNMNHERGKAAPELQDLQVYLW